ncbi:flagellar basal body P-ring formation chaperone FlgA [Vibrio sp. CAU 1672]|uniref:flagellar basal body P-ring formation chaperone FlgA n=1 Tax=Vibrio sp. CAU 1672 TaxID=3032594 RepID=UPI0023D9994A|nr:flagellar basal body P-ring formation chaperone FlgA [Vibrio sp. CAU 1672]MDF2152582.1 flagellar basal body P-ring formation chaperone FlgA [Vibrio sp. CAU 1672]
MIYKQGRKRNFRLTEVILSKGKYAISSLGLGLGFSLPLSAIAQVEMLSEQSLKQHIAQHFEHEVATQARMQHWQDYQLDYKIWVPGAASHLPACPEDLVISGRDNQTLPVGNLKRAVSCQAVDSPWRISITIKAALTLPVVVTKVSMGRSEVVPATNLQLDQRTLTRQEDFYTAITDAAGLETTRRIRAGQIVNPNNLSAPPLVEKGNQVVIIASKDGFTATTKGVALEDGKKNQQIEVRNSKSGKVIKAVVTGLNQVHTQF